MDIDICQWSNSPDSYELLSQGGKKHLAQESGVGICSPLVLSC